MALKKVWIEEGCTLCELCVSTCPTVFQMGSDSAEVNPQADLTAYESCLRKAADLCPVEIIKIQE